MLACRHRDGDSPTMLRPQTCVPRDGDSPTMLRPLTCVPRGGGHPMPDSHPEIVIRRSLVEAHSSVTPGQGAERPQPGDSSEQRKSASKRLTSISDAHSQRGPCRQSLVCAAPRRRPSYAQHNYTPCGRSNERPYLSVVRVFDDCAVGAHCKSGTETVPLLCQQHSYILNVGTYLGASASGGAPSRGPFLMRNSLI